MASYSSLTYKAVSAGGGTEIAIKEFVYKAAEAGKILYIQAGLHGGETSQWCLYGLHEFLLKNLKRGEVHVVPYVNPQAWMQRVYYSTFGKFSLIDGKDFNRGFPGDKAGDVSARVAAVIMDLAKQADLVVDLHTSKSSRPFVVYTQKKYEHRVKVCGFPYNQYSDDAAVPSLRGTFNAALDVLGVENISIECGGHDDYNQDNINAVLKAICSLLADMQMVEETENSPKEVYCFEKRKKIFSPCGGLFKAEKNIGTKIRAGEVVGRVYNADDLSDVREVRAAFDCVLLTVDSSHIVWEGDILAEVVPEDDLVLL